MNKRILFLLFVGVLFSGTLFSQSVLSFDRYWDNGGANSEWSTLENWGNNMLPEIDADVHINNDYSASISMGMTTSFEVESIAIGADGDNSGKSELVPPVMILNTSGNLTIADGYSLTVSKGGHEGSNCVRIEGVSGNESSLTINGTLNINKVNGSGDGLDINPYTSVTVGSTGDLNINAKGFHAIEISDDLTNFGTIDIIATANCKDGIHFSGPISGSNIINYASGSITIDGNNLMDFGIDLNSAFTFDNYGSLIISETDDYILNGQVDFNNYGTFGGKGIINCSNFDAGGAGATISPGTSTSTGKLSFINNDVDLSDVDINIDINSAGSYDQLEIIGNTMTISNANLNFSGSYVPLPGDEFILINNLGTISGTFLNLDEGDPIFINGVEMTLSYNSGNNITITNLAPLPVELISFNGYAEERENILKWQTASEENTMVFIVERSLDGVSDFEEIDRINAVGFSTTLQNYEAKDDNPVSLAYYRLRIIDFDGTFEFSDIIAIERMKTDIDLVEVYPVPAEDEVTVLIHSTSDNKAIMILSDFSGRKIKEDRITLKTGINRFILNWEEHETNYYYLTIETSKGKIAKKILRASKD